MTIALLGIQSHRSHANHSERSFRCRVVSEQKDFSFIRTEMMGAYSTGSNPNDEPTILLGNSSKATSEDLLKAGGLRSEIDEKIGKRIIYQTGGGRDPGVFAD